VPVELPQATKTIKKKFVAKLVGNDWAKYHASLDKSIRDAIDGLDQKMQQGQGHNVWRSRVESMACNIKSAC
jgi:hypothetical protein